MDHTQDWTRVDNGEPAGLDSGVTIHRIGRTNVGGDSPTYVISVPGAREVTIDFQDGPVGDEGINGIQTEHLIMVALDRMRSFQKGKFACRENALVVTKLEEALQWLHARTHDRRKRQVEGKNEA